MDRVRLDFDLRNLKRAPILHLLGDGKRFFLQDDVRLYGHAVLISCNYAA